MEGMVEAPERWRFGLKELFYVTAVLCSSMATFGPTGLYLGVHILAPETARIIY